MAIRYYGGNQALAELNLTNQDIHIIDCTKATAAGALNQAVWFCRQASPRVQEPLEVNGTQTDAIEVFGGMVNGNLDPTQHRANNAGGLYQIYNGAGIKFSSINNIHLHDYVFGQTESWRDAPGHVWDAIRCNVSSTRDATMLIERCWVRGCRDDFIESDASNAEQDAGLISGGTITIRDCLAEGCFGGISTTNLQQQRHVIIDNIGLMLTNFFEDEVEGTAGRTFGPLFKPDASGNVGPRYTVTDSVFAYQTYDGGPMPTTGQHGWGTGGRVGQAFSRMTATNSFLCVLASGGLPSNYATNIPAGLTVLTGSAAQNKWNEKRAELIEILTSVIIEPPDVVWVKRNLMTLSQNPRRITIDRRIAHPATTLTVRATGPDAFDDEVFSVTIT
jgi:hypothetical protein